MDSICSGFVIRLYDQFDLRWTCRINYLNFLCSCKNSNLREPPWLLESHLQWRCKLADAYTSWTSSTTSPCRRRDPKRCWSCLLPVLIDHKWTSCFGFSLWHIYGTCCVNYPHEVQLLFYSSARGTWAERILPANGYRIRSVETDFQVHRIRPVFGRALFGATTPFSDWHWFHLSIGRTYTPQLAFKRMPDTSM